MTGSAAVGLVAGLALVGVGVCALGWRRSVRRLTALEGRVARLEREVHDDVVPIVDLARRESEEARAAARQARSAVGIEDPPPRLAGERVTAPVVRAIAFGAGARRALARFGADVTPLARTRRTTMRVVGATRGRTAGRGAREAGATRRPSAR